MDAVQYKLPQNETDPFETKYGEGESIAPQLILGAWIIPVFPAIFIGARFYTTRCILRTKPKEDWFILVALIFSALFSLSVTLQTQYGLARHWGDVPSGDPKGDYEKYLLISAFGTSTAYSMANLFTKLSILCFYLRFITDRCFTYAVYVTIVFVSAFNFVGATGVLYWCRPLKNFWLMPTAEYCINSYTWYVARLAVNLLADVIILVMPIFILRPLRVEFAQKIAIGGILGTGSFVLGVSVFRFAQAFIHRDDEDYTWRLAINYGWSLMELNVAIICACLPCLKPLLVRLFPRVRWLKAAPQLRDLETISESTLTDRGTSTDVAERRIDWAALRASHGVKNDTQATSTDVTSTDERAADATRGRATGRATVPGNSI